MPKIFLIASAVLLLLSAGLSFANKSKLAAKNLELGDAHTAATAAQSAAAKAKTAQMTAEKNAADAATKASELQGQLTAATTQTSELNTKLADATKNVTDLQTKLDAAIAEKNAAPKTPAGEPIPDAAQKIADLTHQLDEQKVVREGLEGQVKTAQAQTAMLSKRIADHDAGIVANGLRGQVLAVDHNWNFVVLNLGNRNGVNNAAEMIVQRGGSMVGRVKITSVEPSQSVADIIPNSVPAGVDVRPGDTVVFQGVNR